VRLRFRFVALCLLMLGIVAGPAAAQDDPPPDSTRRPPADSLQRRPAADTLAAPPQVQAQRPAGDSLVANRSGNGNAPSSSSRQGKGLKAPVKFKARDSLIVDLGSDQEATLYGKAQATYQKSVLTAHQIDMLLERDELEAQGMPSDTGLVGRPKFKRGEEDPFYGDRLAYNLRTERGRVQSARTSIQEGFVQGSAVKMMEDSTLYVADALYTTCDCEDDPSYSLRSDRMKMKEKWVYSGPMQLFLFNIPTPLWLPFGFLPATQGRRSGPLPFDYGEDGRGFYLRNVGWYQIINEYMDVQLTGGYWTSGSWQLNSRFRYNKRYAYDGNFSFDYRQVKLGEETDQDYSEKGTIRLQWRHQQEFTPHTSLRSRVNLTSRSHLRASDDLDDQIRQDVSSSARFQKQWRSVGRSFSAQLRQKQYFQTGRVNLTLPSISFRQTRRKPFQRENRPPGEEERWYEKITYRYSSSLDNGFSYPTREQRLRNGVDSTNLDIPWYEALVSPSTYRKATGDVIPFDFQASHNVPVQASFSVQEIFGQPVFLSLNPNFDYQEEWRLFRRRLHPTDSSEESGGFGNERDGLAFKRETDFTALRQFDTGVSAKTRFYGTFPWRIGALEGLRHTVRPSLNFGYRPNFRDPFWGYTDTFRDSTYTVVERRYLNGPQKRIGLSLNNLFQTKYVTTDSTGERQSRTLSLLKLDANISYNAASERRPLSTLRLSARPPFLNRSDRADVRLTAGFSPYALDNNQRRTDRYVWQDGRPPRLDRLSLTIGTELGPGETRRSSLGGYGGGRYGGGRGYGGRRRGGGQYGSSRYSNSGTSEPTDFSIPWALSLNFSYDLTRQSGSLESSDAILNSSFTFNPTPKWLVRGDTGYDFKKMEFSTTRLQVYRNLGCWEMSINWVPFGRFQQYGFTLQVKSGKLRDLLKLSHPRSSVKDRFSGLLN
jgi:hypothetical protein